MSATTGPAKHLRRLALAGIWLLAGLATLWAVAALYFDVRIEWLRLPLTVGYAVGVLGLWVRVRRPWKLVFTGIGFTLVLAWWLGLQPSNHREWQPDVARTPAAEISGQHATLQGIRDCDYRTETNYTVHYRDETFDLDQLRTVDLYLVTWGSPNIAHTMVSFGFTTGDYVCFSIETRKEIGESYSAIRGLFRQYELIYIVADERDVVRLRTNYRKDEEVCLYRLEVTPAEGRQLFMDYVRRINELHAHGEWYNALTDNCTTAIRTQRSPGERMPWDWRMLVNGHLDELLYQRHLIVTNLPFAELKKLSNINARARAAGDAADFSAQIRRGLPGFAPEAAGH